jgi:dihydrofolate synthase/folylpolyglutamate synthase
MRAAARMSAVAASDAILDRLGRLHPRVIDLSLGRMRRLLAALGHPEAALPPVIHVAGTNGKGSVTAMLRAGLEGLGETVHAYTSPHLSRFHERIRVGGALIEEDRLARLLDECERANEGAPITFFEITTAAALLAFARIPADRCLLEVGLGGRLDATNVVAQPALTVITPVSMDHQDWLGDTLGQIAAEKAGILKPGVPCVVAPQATAAMEAIEARAEAVGAPLLVHGRHWQVWEERGGMVLQDETGLMDLPLPRLLGAHQVVNAGTAVMALRALDRAAGADAAVTRAEWPARMQRLTRGPLVEAAGRAELWLDGGHNPAAGNALAETQGRLPPRPLHLVCGMMRVKDARGFLAPLAGRAQTLHAVPVPGTDAGMAPDDLVAAARAVGLVATAAPDPGRAVGAIEAADPGARILICGSLYLAGDVLRANG